MLNDSLIDKRIVERNIKKGKVDAAAYQQTLAALPDLSARVWRQEDRPAHPAAAPVAPVPAAAAVAPAGAAPALNAGVDDGWTDNDEDDEDETTAPAQPSPFG